MKIPCKECIVFAICKQRVKEWTKPHDFLTFTTMIKCDPIHRYRESILGNTEAINKARKLFGLRKIGSLDLDEGYDVVYKCHKRSDR